MIIIRYLQALMLFGIVCCFSTDSYSSVHYFQNNPSLVGIRINNGQRVTNKIEVSIEVKSLKLDDKLIAEMQIGLSSDLSDGKWMPYTTEKKQVTLKGQDGMKTVYVRLKDKAGNLSPIENAEILLDTSPPHGCSLIINGGSELTNDRQMRAVLTLAATDAVKMQISNSPGFENATWENFAETKSWILGPAGDGNKTVHARFMDAAQNISESINASIIVDTQPPKNGTVVINDNEKFTRTPKVNIRITAEDADKVMLVDRLGKTEIFSFENGNDKLLKEWEFDTLQGTKTIKAFFMDKAGNKTVTAATDDIIFDSQGPPPPIILINNGAKYTNSADGKVNVKFTSRVAISLLKMQISHSIDFQNKPIVPAVASIDGYQLDHSQDGIKYIYARYYDEAGNPSEAGKAEIILDREKPVIKKLEINGGAEWITTSKVNISIDTQGASHMQIGASETIFRSTVWEPFKSVVGQFQLPVGEGEKVVYVRLKDEAENISDPAQVKVMMDTKPPVGEIVIDIKNKFTNHKDKKVDLLLKVDDAAEMMLSESADFKNMEWQSIKPSVSGFVLSGDDGPKTLFLKLRDKAGNVSTSISAGIILDRLPPQECKLLINNGARWLNNPTKRATLSFVAKGATEMIVDHQSTFPSAKWLPLKPTMGWTFEGTDGQKKVYAKFRDEAGNESETLEASIMLDTQAPELEKFLIDNGVQFTNNKDLKTVVTVTAKGAHFLSLSNKPFDKPDLITWTPFAEQIEWKLEGEEGAKTVFLILKDSAGNISQSNTANIILDKTPPQGGKILINNNDKYINHPDKRANLMISVSHAIEMMVSNDPQFKDAKWEPYQNRKENWILEGDEGEKIVYARFRDEAGNISEPAMDKIILDRKPPTNPKVLINDDSVYTSRKDRMVRLKLSVVEGKEMIISQDRSFSDAKWEAFQPQKDFVLKGEDGEKEVFVKFRDEAGNESAVVSDKIISDIHPPVPVRLVINDGEEWTNAQNKQITLNIEANGADEMMIASDSEFKDGRWIAYATQMSFILPGEDGDKQVFVKFRDKAGNISNIVSANVKLKRAF